MINCRNRCIHLFAFWLECVFHCIATDLFFYIYLNKLRSSYKEQLSIIQSSLKSSSFFFFFDFLLNYYKVFFSQIYLFKSTSSKLLHVILKKSLIFIIAYTLTKIKGTTKLLRNIDKGSKGKEPNLRCEKKQSKY